MRQFANVAGRDARPLRDFFRRILLYPLAQRVKPMRVLADVIGIVKMFVDDHVHQRQRQRDISSWIDWQVPVGAGSGARAVRIDHHQLCAIAPRLFDERPQMNIVAVNIGAPGDDVLGMAKGLRLAAQLAPHHRDQRLAAGCGANRPV